MSSRGIKKSTVLAVSAISTCLLLIGPQGMLVSLVNLLLSSVVFIYPPAAVPMILASSISSSISLFNHLAAVFYYLLIFFAAQMVRGGFKLHITKSRAYVYLLVFFLWLFLCAVKSPTGEIYSTVRLFLFLLLSWLVAESGSITYSKCVEAVMIVAPVCLAVCSAKMLLFPSKYIVEGQYFTFIRDSIADHINPNQFAQYVAVLCVMSFIGILKKRRWFYAVTLFLAVVLLFVTKSRTSFYGALGICFLYFILEFRMPVRQKAAVIACAALLTIVPIVNVIRDGGAGSASSTDEKSIGVSSVIEDAGSGRFFTWVEVFSDVLPSHPVFGIGIGKENYQAVGMEFDSDDLYVDLLAETGIPGFFLFFLFFFRFLKEVRRKVKVRNGDESMVYLLLIMLLFGIGETIFDSQFFWTIVFFGMLLLRNNGPRRAINAISQ